jgi:hypothetical protein
MNRLARNTAIASVAGLALVAGACAPAFADGDTATHPRTLAAIQASAKAKTTERVDRLDAAITKVTAAKGISTIDRSTILGTLNSDVTAMHAVEAKIAADTTVATASADYKTIFTTYRVYAVAIPQSRLAAGSDRMTSIAIPKLTSAHTKLAAALAAHPTKSTAALQADLSDMSAQVTAASGLLNGVAAKALAVTPADFNSNHDVLASERTAVKSAAADLKKAATDGKTVAKALK